MKSYEINKVMYELSLLEDKADKLATAAVLGNSDEKDGWLVGWSLRIATDNTYTYEYIESNASEKLKEKLRNDDFKKGLKLALRTEFGFKDKLILKDLLELGITIEFN